MKKLAITSALLTTIFITPVQAGVIWDFNYTDVNTGFNDINLGSARQNALQSAGDYVSSFLTGYDATINMDVDGSATGNSLLAAAGTNYTNASYSAGFTERGDVMTKILGGNSADPDSNVSDGSVTWNFNQSWALGDIFNIGEFDFFSTAVHELTHALGFASEILETGSDGYSTASGDPGAWAPFDEFLTSFDGTPLIDSASILDGSLWDDTKISLDGNGTSGCDAGVLFNGANAVAANGGQAVQIYAPGAWEDGSSGSHLDDNCYTHSGNVSSYMMEAQTITGLGVREYSALEIGMMQDIGYTKFGKAVATSVPEPTTAILMFGGILALSGLRRKNKVS
jgi:hypothetical protein